ncbi:MAG: hypothetical protein ACLSB9_29000 [Hydrogeniiclostridium mannosilyticum]
MERQWYQKNARREGAFLIPEIKILSILRAAGEKRQGDIKAMLIKRGMHQHLHNFRFQWQQ